MNKLAPTIIFVPFFGAKKSSLKKHFDLVESLGFQWVFVDLQFNFLKFILKPYSAHNLSFGMKKIWADQIEIQLNNIIGPKIVYAFSNPCAGAIEAIARRGGHDILALICEGGPSGDLYKSILNYYKREIKLPTLPLKMIASLISTYLISPHPDKICFDDLEKFPKNLPILSIRGWKDPLITPTQIDKIFDPHKNLNWKKLNLPNALHLNGLKDHKQDYEPIVSQFLMATKSPSSVGTSKDL